MTDTAHRSALDHQSALDKVQEFYDLHPINLADVLAKLREAHGGTLDGVTVEELFRHDQDHYGGLAANDALAEAARVGKGSRVLDVCAGLGGPARYVAWKYGAHVTGLDLSHGRVEGAIELSRLVGLDGATEFVHGDAMALPFPDESFDAVTSQEAWLHVPDKRPLLAGVFRVLKPGGRLAFTDWTAGPGYGPDEHEMMRGGIAAQDVQTVENYKALLAEAGFTDVTVTDLSAVWVPVLQERLRMYEGLREEAKRRTGGDPHKDYCEFYAAFVGLTEKGALGGARFSAAKP